MHGGLPQIGLQNNPSLVDYHTTYIVEEFCNTVYFCFEKSTSSTVCRLERTSTNHVFSLKGSLKLQYIQTKNNHR